MRKYLLAIQAKIINKTNYFLLNKSWVAAMAQAKKINDRTGKKVFIIMLHGDFLAIPKQDFKKLWNRTAVLKSKTIAEWQKCLYEFKPNSKQHYTASEQ